MTETTARTVANALLATAGIAAAYVVVSAVLSNPKNAAIGAVLIAAGVPAYLLWRRRKAPLA